MKRKALALTFVLALLFSAITGAQLNLLAKANFSLPPTDPSITIVSPTNSTYDVSTLSLEVNFKSFKGILLGSEYVLSAPIIYTYSLDEKDPERISITNSTSDGTFFFYEGAANLTNLTEGLHSLKVYVALDYRGNYAEANLIHTESEATVNFRVDTVPQKVSILMPENNTYTPNGVQLKFFIDEPASWIGYSLDGQENVTVTGDKTLPELSVGQHTLTLYANDTSGNPAASEAIVFTVAEEPFPQDLVVTASVASVGVIAVGLLVYLKRKEKRRKEIKQRED
jgi:hypothetical protein